MLNFPSSFARQAKSRTSRGGTQDEQYRKADAHHRDTDIGQKRMACSLVLASPHFQLSALLLGSRCTGSNRALHPCGLYCRRGGREGRRQPRSAMKESNTELTTPFNTCGCTNLDAESNDLRHERYPITRLDIATGRDLAKLHCPSSRRATTVPPISHRITIQRSTMAPI
eukprot:scaffold37919_cov35-Tisochrysis_lutea.AAC.2